MSRNWNVVPDVAGGAGDRGGGTEVAIKRRQFRPRKRAKVDHASKPLRVPSINPYSYGRIA